MAERLLEIGADPIMINRFLEETLENPAISRMITTRETKLVASELIMEGLLQSGDRIAINYVPDPHLPPDSPTRYVKLYEAYMTPQGTLVATNLLDEFMINVDFGCGN